MAIAALWVVLVFAEASARPPAITFIDDASADLEWARSGFYLHGHWSNTIGIFHPGPVYLALQTVAGRLGEHTAVGFDTAVSIALGLAGLALAAAAGHALARTHRRPALTLGVPAAWLVAAAVTMWRSSHSGEGATFGQFAWAGSIWVWLGASLVIAGWVLIGSWRYRFAYALAVSGLAAQVYLAGLIAGSVLMVTTLTWLVIVVRGRRLGGRALAVAVIALVVTWGPLVVRAVHEGPMTFWPADADADLEHQGVTLAAGLRTLAAPFAVVPALLVLLAYVSVAVTCCVLALRRRGRARWWLVYAALVAVGIPAVQMLVWPGQYNRYQTAWALPVILTALIGLVLARTSYRIGIAASLAVALVAAASGGLIVSTEKLVGASWEVSSVLARVFDEAHLSRSEPVGVVTEGVVWNTGQPITHHLTSLGYMPCTIDRTDLHHMTCTRVPSQVLVVRAVPPEQATLVRTPIGYGASIRVYRDDNGWRDVDTTSPWKHAQFRSSHDPLVPTQ